MERDREHILTDDLVATPFPPHGKVAILVEGPVMRMCITGPFNAELVRAFSSAFVAAMGRLPPDQPFACLAEWQGSLLTQPDALAMYKRLLINSRPALGQLRGTVFLIPEHIEARALMLPLWRRLYDEVDYRMAVASSAPEADVLLASMLTVAPDEGR